MLSRLSFPPGGSGDTENLHYTAIRLIKGIWYHATPCQGKGLAMHESHFYSDLELQTVRTLVAGQLGCEPDEILDVKSLEEVERMKQEGKL